MSIENRNLQVGTRLVARYKKQDHSATVVEGEAGGLRYRLEDGREFKSLSSAGSAIMDGKACNGWRFWSIAGSEQAKPKAPKQAPRAKANPNGGQKGNGLITRLDDGRYFCSACQAAFSVPEGVEPQGCPKGHTPQQDEPAPTA